MDEADILREYEGKILRPKWDYLSTQASLRAGVLNWESAPADAWSGEGAVSYANMVVKWAIQIPRYLEAVDPQGTSTDPRLTSLRRLFEFHIGKMIHLQNLGISVPAVPSDLEAAWEGFKKGLADIPGNLDPTKWPWWKLALVGVAALALILSIRRK